MPARDSRLLIARTVQQLDIQEQCSIAEYRGRIPVDIYRVAQDLQFLNYALRTKPQRCNPKPAIIHRLILTGNLGSSRKPL